MLRCWQPNAATIVEAAANRVSLRRASKRASPQLPPPLPRSTPPPPPPPPQTPAPLRQAVRGARRYASRGPDGSADDAPSSNAPFVKMAPFLSLLTACQNGQYPVVIGFFPQGTHKGGPQERAFDQAAGQLERSAVFRKCCPVESPDVARVCGVESGDARVLVFRPEADTLSLDGDALLEPTRMLGSMLGADDTTVGKPTPKTQARDKKARYQHVTSRPEVLPELVRLHPAFRHVTTLQELEEASAPKDGESAPVVVLHFYPRTVGDIKRMLDLFALHGERAVFLSVAASKGEINAAFNVFEPAILVLRGGKEVERLVAPTSQSVRLMLEAYLDDDSPDHRARFLPRQWAKAYSKFPPAAQAQVSRALSAGNPEMKVAFGSRGARVEGGTLVEAYKAARLTETTYAVIEGCTDSMRRALSGIARTQGYMFARWGTTSSPDTCFLLRTEGENSFRDARIVTLPPASRKEQAALRTTILREHFWALGNPLLLSAVTDESGYYLLCANAPQPIHDQLHAVFPDDPSDPGDFNGVCTESLSLSDFTQRAEHWVPSKRPHNIPPSTLPQALLLYATRTPQGGVVAVANNIRGWVFTCFKESLVEDDLVACTLRAGVMYLSFRQAGAQNTMEPKLLRACRLMQRAELVLAEDADAPASLDRVRSAEEQGVSVLISGKRAALLGSVEACDAVLAKWTEDGVSMDILDEKSWGEADVAGRTVSSQHELLPKVVRVHPAFRHVTTLQELEEASAPKDGESAPVVVLHFYSRTVGDIKRMLDLFALHGERAVFLSVAASKGEINAAFNVFEPAILVLRGGKEVERLLSPGKLVVCLMLEAYLNDDSPDHRARFLPRQWTKAYAKFPPAAQAQVLRALFAGNPEMKVAFSTIGARVEGGTLVEAYKVARLAETTYAVIEECNSSMRQALSSITRAEGYLFVSWPSSSRASTGTGSLSTCFVLRTEGENSFKNARIVTLPPASSKRQTTANRIRNTILREHFWALGNPLLIPAVTDESGCYLLCANAPQPEHDQLHAVFPDNPSDPGDFNGVCTESLSLSDFIQRAEHWVPSRRPHNIPPSTLPQALLLYATRTPQGGVVAVANNIRGWVFTCFRESVVEDDLVACSLHAGVMYLSFRQAGAQSTMKPKLLRACRLMQRAELVLAEDADAPASLDRVRSAEEQGVSVLISGKRAALLGSVEACDAVLAKWTEDGVSMDILDKKSWGEADASDLEVVPKAVRLHPAFRRITTLQELEEASVTKDGGSTASASVRVLIFFDSRMYWMGTQRATPSSEEIYYINRCLEHCVAYAERAVFRWVDVAGPGESISTALKVDVSPHAPAVLVLRGGVEVGRQQLGVEQSSTKALLEAHLGDDSPGNSIRLLPPSWCRGFAALAPDARAEIARRVCSDPAVTPDLRLDVTDQSAVRVLGGTLPDAYSAVAKARDAVAVIAACNKTVCQALWRSAAQEGYAFATIEQANPGEDEVEGTAPPPLSSCVLARLDGGQNRFLAATTCSLEVKGAGDVSRPVLRAHFSAKACPLVIDPLTDEEGRVGLVFATKEDAAVSAEVVRVAFLNGSTDDHDGQCPEYVPLSAFVTRAESAVLAQRLRAPERHSSLPQAALVYAARVKNGGVVAAESNLRGWVLDEYCRRIQELTAGCCVACEAAGGILFLSYRNRSEMTQPTEDRPLHAARRLQRAELALADDAPAGAFTDRESLAKKQHNVVVLCNGRRAALLGSAADCKNVVAEWRADGLDMSEVAEDAWGTASPQPETTGEAAVDAADTDAGDTAKGEGDAEAFAELIGHIEDSSTEAARLQEAEREADVVAETDKARRERQELAQSLRGLIAHTAAVRDAALAYWPLDDDEALKKATTSISLDLEALSANLAKEMPQFYDASSAAVPDEKLQERPVWDSMLERGYKEGAESTVWTQGSWDDAMCVRDLFGLDAVTGEVGTILDWRLLTSSTRHGNRRTRVMVLDTSSLLAQKLPTQRDTKIIIPFTTLRELKALQQRDEIGERAAKRYEEVLARLRETASLCNVALLGPKEEVALYRESERAAYSLARKPSIRVPDDRILLAAYAVRMEMKSVARSCHGDARRQHLADAVLMLSEDQELNSRASEMRLGTTVPPLLCSSD